MSSYKLLISAILISFLIVSDLADSHATAQEISPANCYDNIEVDLPNWRGYLSPNFKVNGFDAPLRVIFDTGSSDAVASLEHFLSNLNQNNLQIRQLQTFRGSSTGVITAPLPISTTDCKIGTAPLTLLPEADETLGSIQATAGSAVLIIGPKSFPKYDFEIDFPQRRMRLLPTQVVNPNISNATYRTIVKFNDQSFACILDTGFVTASGIFVRAESRLAEYLDTLQVSRRDSNIKISGETFPVWQMLARGIEVGGLEGTALIQIEKMSDNIMNTLSSTECFIGTDSLLKTTVTIRQNEPYATLSGQLNSGRYNRTGIKSITLINNEHLRINSIEDNSPAASSAIKPGSFIYMIEGVQIMKIKDASVIRDSFSRPAGSVVTIGLLQDGEEKLVHLTLEETL